jgi:hypothetical protein
MAQHKKNETLEHDLLDGGKAISEFLGGDIDAPAAFGE